MMDTNHEQDTHTDDEQIELAKSLSESQYVRDQAYFAALDQWRMREGNGWSGPM